MRRCFQGITTPASPPRVHCELSVCTDNPKCGDRSYSSLSQMSTSLTAAADGEVGDPVPIPLETERPLPAVDRDLRRAEPAAAHDVDAGNVPQQVPQRRDIRQDERVPVEAPALPA